MSATETQITMNDLEQSVYRCLCYFDVFSHPVTLEEVSNGMDALFDEQKVKTALRNMVSKGWIEQTAQFFHLPGDGPGMITTRLDNESRFAKKKRWIRTVGSFIALFPFVKAVCVSGSCAKGLLEEEGDFDFFIITSKNRLWICRSLLVGFKKIFLFNSKKYFCVNYFVSEDQLNIPDSNIFVAHEITTLSPVTNARLVERFRKENEWTTQFLPQRMMINDDLCVSKGGLPISFGVVRFLLSNRLGEWLDKKLFGLTLSVWKRKFTNFNEQEFDLNMRSRRSVSKHHPRGFQKKVLDAMDARLLRFQVNEVTK